MLKAQHPFWVRWTRAILRRPLWVIGLAFAVTALAGVQAWRTPKELSFTGLLDDSDVEINHFRETVETFGSNAMLVVLIEGDRREIDRAIAALVDELPDRVDVKSITPPADAEWLIDRAPWVWPRPLFDRVVDAVRLQSAPSELVAALEQADAVMRTAIRPVDEAALVGIGLHRSPLDMALGGEDFYAVERATQAILDEYDCNVSHAFTGLTAAAAQDQRSVMSRIRILTPVTLVVVLVLLTGVEPRLSRVLLAGAALSFSVVIAYGLTGLALGRLSITVTFFGMLLLGLGIDFGIHLLVALRDARSHGKSAEDSVGYGIRHTASAISLGGLSTALAFGLVALAPEPGARDMGLAALFGLLAALALMLTLLPAGWLVLERRHAANDAPPRFRLPGLHTTVAYSVGHPRRVVAIALVLVAISLAGIPRYTLETDLQKIISRQVTTFEVDRRIAELFGVAHMSYLAPVESLDEARTLARELKALDEISRVVSPSDIVPVDSDERLAAAEAALRAANDESATPLSARLDRALKAGPISVDTIPPSLANGLIGDNGEIAISIVPKDTVFDAEHLAGQIDRVQAIAPTATGMPVIIRLAVLGSRDYIPILIPAILFVVTLVLALAMRSARDVVLALVPVLVGAALCFGVFLWFGLQMSLLTTAIVPVILGLGVDDGIHVVERIRQYARRDTVVIVEAVESVGRAIFLTTATTSVSFIALLFTNHAGLESLAWFMLIGVPLCFVASITVLPATAALLANSEETDSPSNADNRFTG